MKYQFCHDMHSCLQMNKQGWHRSASYLSHNLWKVQGKKVSPPSQTRQISGRSSRDISLRSYWVLVLPCLELSMRQWRKPIFCMKSCSLIWMGYFCMISAMRLGRVMRAGRINKSYDRETQGVGRVWCPLPSGLLKALHHLVPPSANHFHTHHTPQRDRTNHHKYSSQVRNIQTKWKPRHKNTSDWQSVSI